MVRVHAITAVVPSVLVALCFIVAPTAEREWPWDPECLRVCGMQGWRAEDSSQCALWVPNVLLCDNVVRCRLAVFVLHNVCCECVGHSGSPLPFCRRASFVCFPCPSQGLSHWLGPCANSATATSVGLVLVCVTRLTPPIER